MKTKISVLLLTAVLLFSLSACKGNTTEQTANTAQSEKTSSPAEKEAAAEASTKSGKGKVLVVYFSATGTTKGVAEKIAKIENADLYEIKPAQAYSDADLNWNDSSSRSTKEQNDKSARPEIASEKLSLDGYSTIYIGYPIWWGEEPRITDTFVESYNFDGITMIPFCTSGGSGIGRSDKNLEDNAKSGNWLDGERLDGNASEADIRSWVESVK